MAKKNTPIITHTEILVRAIRSIEDEIERWQCGPSNLGPAADEGFADTVREMVEASTAPLIKKLEALKEMYRIETGTDYV